MILSNIFIAIIYICLFLLILFVVKEIWRNKDIVWREILEKNNEKNINNLLGITKTTFLALITALMLVSIGCLTLAETANKNQGVEGRKYQNDCRLFILK